MSVSSDNGKSHSHNKKNYKTRSPEFLQN